METSPPRQERRLKYLPSESVHPAPSCQPAENHPLHPPLNSGRPRTRGQGIRSTCPVGFRHHAGSDPWPVDLGSRFSDAQKAKEKSVLLRVLLQHRPGEEDPKFMLLSPPPAFSLLISPATRGRPGGGHHVAWQATRLIHRKHTVVIL